MSLLLLFAGATTGVTPPEPEPEAQPQPGGGAGGPQTYGRGMPLRRRRAALPFWVGFRWAPEFHDTRSLGLRLAVRPPLPSGPFAPVRVAVLPVVAAPRVVAPTADASLLLRVPPIPQPVVRADWAPHAEFALGLRLTWEDESPEALMMLTQWIVADAAQRRAHRQFALALLRGQTRTPPAA